MIINGIRDEIDDVKIGLIKLTKKKRATRDLNPRLFAPKANTLPPELATLIDILVKYM